MQSSYQGGNTPWRGNRGGRSSQAPRPVYLARDIPEAHGTLISTFSLDDPIEDEALETEARIKNCEVIASYNLLETKRRTILAPGTPPLWTPPKVSNQLSIDSGTYFRDDNAARFPKHPMEPAVASIVCTNPAFDGSKVDIFGCASTIGNVIRFSLENHQPFCFVVQVVASTAFFLRREASPTEVIEGVRGYGHSFPEAYTIWEKDVKGSVSHQRILSYVFGGLQMLVRFECDGYVGDESTTASNASGSEQDEPVEDTFERLLKSTQPVSDDQPLQAKPAGRLVPQSDVFDLKTRSYRNPRMSDTIKNEVPRLWVRQISKFILAIHRDGKFDDDVGPKDLTKEIEAWEDESQNALRRAAFLLREIIKAARKTADGKIEVRTSGPRALQFRQLSTDEGKQWNAIPSNLKDMWTEQALRTSSSD